MLNLNRARRQAIGEFLETANNRSGVKWQSIDADHQIFYAMMTRRAIIWPLLLCVSMALFAQKPGATFKATSRLVQVSVSVTRAGNGASIAGLTSADFLVKDNGKLRQVTSFAHGDQRNPLRILFLVESSSAQVDAVRGLIDALPRGLGRLPSTDSVGIASVFPGYKVLLDPTVVRTAIPPALEQLRINQQAYLKALDAPDKESRPRFDFDDLSRALIDISESKPVKNQQLVIVIVTDDFDLLNPNTSAGAAQVLIKNATLVAAFIDIQNVGISIANRNVHVMRMVTPMRLAVRDRGASYFAEQTGGPVVHVRNRNYLGAVETLLGTLSNAYLVGFTPRESELDGKYHKLDVSVKRSALKGKVKIAYRKGYWADR